MPTLHEPATPDRVFAAVAAAVQRELPDCNLQQIDAGDDRAVYGFTVDGTDYSLGVNVTPRL